MTPRPRRRLALLHYTVPPITGGVESILAAQARLLREAGHDVRVIAGRGDAELVPEADSRHPEVERVALRLAEGACDRDEFDSLASRLEASLRPLLDDRDVVIAHNVLTMPFNLPLAAALVAIGRPLLAWTHDLAWVNPRYEAYHHEGWPWSILHEAQPHTRYVAISELRRAQIASTLDLGPGEVDVVPNGIDAEAFWGLGPVTRQLVERAGLRDAAPLVLVPFRITPRKRLELAVAAAATLRRSWPGVRVVVSGPLGPHSRANAQYVSDLRRQRAELGLDGVVTFLADLAGPDGGHPVDDRSIAELYRIADVILLPSESEGFGLPVLEAGLSGAPLVCPDIPVLREVAHDDAWYFPAGGDADAVAEAVSRALDGKQYRLRRRVLDGYQWPAVLERLERVIEAGADGG